MAIIQIVLFIGGTYYAFYSNGAIKGKDFSKRFFSIGWVFLLRATFFMGIGMLNLYMMTYLFGVESLFTVKNSAIIALIFEILFYWRIGMMCYPYFRQVPLNITQPFDILAS